MKPRRPIPETQIWLRELLAEPADASPRPNLPQSRRSWTDSHEPGWQKKFIDPQALATEAMRKGQPQKGVRDPMSKKWSGSAAGAAVSSANCSSRSYASARARTPSRSPCSTTSRPAWKPTSWKIGRIVRWWRVCSPSCCSPARRFRPTPRPSKLIFERICRLDPVQAFSV